MSDENKLRELVAEVAAAYFSNTHVNPSEIPTVIGQISSSLQSVKEPGPDDAPPAEGPEQHKLTASQIRKSVTPDAIISFEDGRSYKTMKRHLSQKGLTPADYRAKWGLPKDYPMTAPSYSERRSALAKSLGLGQRAKQATPRRRKAAAKG